MTYSQILGVQTRSMVRKEAIKQEASYKKLILTTPGIITQIANQLSIDDIGFKGLFLLVNDQHYRYELQPFTDIIKLNHFNEKQKIQMIYDLQEYFIKFNDLTDTMTKANSIIEMYQYLVNNIEYLHLLHKRFGIIVKNKLDELITQINDEQFNEFDIHYKIFLLSKFHQLKVKLKTYFDWASSQNVYTFEKDTEIEIY